jgi:hypothetical protein
MAGNIEVVPILLDHRAAVNIVNKMVSVVKLTTISF